MILHINSYYSDRDFYGNLYDNFNNKKLEQIIYVPIAFNNKANEKAKSQSIVSESYSNLDRLLFFPKHNKIFNDVLQKVDINNISLIHSFSLFSNGYIAYKLWLKYGVKYIVTVRNSDINFFFKKIKVLNSLGRRILNNAETIIFLSNVVKESTINNFINKNDRIKISNKSIVVPNGIDDFWHKEKLLENKKINNPTKILYVGELTKNKNVTRIIKASEQLNKEGILNELIIVGKKIENSVYKNVVNSKAIYYGSVDKEKLLEIYRNSDIFVLASHKETFGLVYAEALSQSLPIIYTKGQGFDSQFTNGEVGYSVNSNKVEDIKNAVINIIDNYDELQNNINLKAISKFDWKKISNKYIEMYRKIIYKNKRKG